MIRARPSVGVLLVPGPVSAWVADAIEQLAEVADVVRVEVPRLGRPPALPLTARLVDRFLTREAATASAPAAALRPLAPHEGRGLDVLVDLVGDGADPLADSTCGTLVLGIDGRRGHEIPPGRDRCIRRSLEFRRPDGTWVPAGEAVQRRDPVSRVRALDAALWSSPGLLRGAMARLTLDQTLEAPRPERPSVSARMMPLPVEVLRSAWRRATASDARERWHLVVRCPAPIAGTPISAAEAASAVAPIGRSWADPFLVELDGVQYVLFEDVPAGGRGKIAMAAVGSDGRLGPARIVLERPYHLSYPFVIQRDGRRPSRPSGAEHHPHPVLRRTCDATRGASSQRRGLRRAPLEGVGLTSPRTASPPSSGRHRGARRPTARPASASVSRMSRLRVEAVRAHAVDTPTSAAWDDLAISAGRPYSSPGWCLAWSGNGLADPGWVLVVRAGQDVVGVAAVEPLRLHAGGTATYGLVGASISSGIQPLARAGLEGDVARVRWRKGSPDYVPSRER